MQYSARLYYDETAQVPVEDGAHLGTAGPVLGEVEVEEVVRVPALHVLQLLGGQGVPLIKGSGVPLARHQFDK
jgi:hypothetical protein